MEIYYNSYTGTRPTAVALGNFDGVHIGHKKLIEKITDAEGLSSLVYTFSSHPLNDLQGEGTVKNINTNEEIVSVFQDLGVDEIFFDSFLSVASMSPETYVKEVLVEKLHAREVVCGFNYRFGHKASGDPRLLEELLSFYGVHLTVVPEVTFEGKTVSSTLVRDVLSSGDVERAGLLLGRPYFVKSPVVHGKALGRKLGFPTANLVQSTTRLALPVGVYFGICRIDTGEEFPSVINVGRCPTVDDTVRAVTTEAHLIGFDGDLYGREVHLEFLTKHRGEMKFPSLDALSAQIRSDVDSCLTYLKRKDELR